MMLETNSAGSQNGHICNQDMNTSAKHRQAHRAGRGGLFRFPLQSVAEPRARREREGTVSVSGGRGIKIAVQVSTFRESQA